MRLPRSFITGADIVKMHGQPVHCVYESHSVSSRMIFTSLTASDAGENGLSNHISAVRMLQELTERDSCMCALTESPSYSRRLPALES